VRAVQNAVARLPERQRVVFLLRFIEDMPLEEIAEVLGLESGTVKTHLHRATETVRKACIKPGKVTGRSAHSWSGGNAKKAR
jgi:RNA polymerase sigma-70 factor (ECF subfamily)